MQIVEFDVEEGASPDVVGLPLKEAKIPPDSKVASIIRDGGLILPRGVESIRSATASSSSALLRLPGPGAA